MTGLDIPDVLARNPWTARIGRWHVLARRKPRLLLRLPGLFLLRFAERAFSAVLFHEPPRITRLEPPRLSAQKQRVPNQPLPQVPSIGMGDVGEQAVGAVDQLLFIDPPFQQGPLPCPELAAQPFQASPIQSYYIWLNPETEKWNTLAHRCQAGCRFFQLEA